MRLLQLTNPPSKTNRGNSPGETKCWLLRSLTWRWDSPPRWKRCMSAENKRQDCCLHTRRLRRTSKTRLPDMRAENPCCRTRSNCSTDFICTTKRESTPWPPRLTEKECRITRTTRASKNLQVIPTRAHLSMTLWTEMSKRHYLLKLLLALTPCEWIHINL